MKSHMLKRLLVLASTVTTLGTAPNAVAQPTQPKGPAKVPAKTIVVDAHAKDRETFVDNYKALCLDFEGDFPAIYWDNGNLAAPGGVKLDPSKKMTVRKITSLDGSRIPVKSYKKDIKSNMLLMADKGVLPAAYKGKFKIEQIQLDVGTLNKGNIPDYKDTTFTNAVYYVPSVQRNLFHEQAIRKHLKDTEDWLGADRFYNLPIARQVAIVDMLYVLGPQKFKKTKFAKSVLANDWAGAIREAYASKDEKDKRRHKARKLLLFWGSEDLMPINLLPIYNDVENALPKGETKLAENVNAVLGATADVNEQRFIRKAAMMKQKGLKK